MNELKKLNKISVAKNAYKMIIDSKRPIEKVAESLGISERAIYYWQKGKRSPSLEQIYGLSQLFNVSMESILA